MKKIIIQALKAIGAFTLVLVYAYVLKLFAGTSLTDSLILACVLLFVMDKYWPKDEKG
jgi:hypothetical protein